MARQGAGGLPKVRCTEFKKRKLSESCITDVVVRTLIKTGRVGITTYMYGKELMKKYIVIAVLLAVALFCVFKIRGSISVSYGGSNPSLTDAKNAIYDIAKKYLTSAGSSKDDHADQIKCKVDVALSEAAAATRSVDASSTNAGTVIRRR